MNTSINLPELPSDMNGVTPAAVHLFNINCSTTWWQNYWTYEVAHDRDTH